MRFLEECNLIIYFSHNVTDCFFVLNLRVFVLIFHLVSKLCLKMLLSLSVFLLFISLSNSIDIEIDSVDYSPQKSPQYDLVALVNNIKDNVNLLVNSNGEENQIYYEKDLNYDEDEDNFFFMSGETSTSSKCLDDVSYTVESLSNITANPWALQFFDSYGKPESGITVGNLKWMGNYLECLDVYAPPKTNSTAGNFNGKYCSLGFSLENMSLPLDFVVGMCIPDTCTAEELSSDYIKLLNLAKSIPVFSFNDSLVKLKSFKCKENSKPLNAPTIAVICLISFFVLLVILGSSVTAYEYYSEKDKSCDAKSREINNTDHIPNSEDSDVELLLRQKSHSDDYFEMIKPFLKCFCLFTNGSKLLDTQGTEEQLLCIHGIRFLSMTWVILGHTYTFSATVANNLFQAVKLTDNLAFQVMYQAFYSVDSFFVLSGFLLTYLFLKEFSKSGGKMSWTYFYVHRYLRLTPLYMIVLGFSSTIYFYLGSGPNWPDNDLDPICQKWWWTNLLYINNFFSVKKLCMGYSWYLSNDMQFFIISPLFLITLSRWPKVGYSLLALFFLENWLANFLITYYYDLFAGVTAMDVNFIFGSDNWIDFYEKLYVKPYARIGPYLVGILTGYLLFKNKENNEPKLNKVTLLGGWVVASSVTLTLVYGLYHTHPSKVANSFFGAFNRTLFGAGLSWVIYVCLTGQGGVVNKILSFKLFIPLSRLTYTAYLIHPLFLTGYYLSMKGSLTLSHSTLVLHFLGFLLVTYSFSVLVSLIFESPIIGIEKLIRKKFQNSR